MGNANLDEQAIVGKIREQAQARLVKFTLHAHQEMRNDEVTIPELLSMLADCHVLENYPEYDRGPCCLVGGTGHNGRNLHVVCTTKLPELVIITVYEPTKPYWETPYKRGAKS
ncbi:MAG: hypothetical protein A2511_17655 [Deltaproteobacteria bacterium RIFOXYD12_FULL_50_9]|nr:MAG: hypothetical protein A2511_17655 [Deltaproteobacteria bacterium RIFOXYD12_FULL_50_9]